MTRFAFLGAIAFGMLSAFGTIDPASAQDCATPNLKSLLGTQATELTFVNKGPESRRIFWIDFKGERKFYVEIGPGQSHKQPTYIGHLWIAAREDDRCQTVVAARAFPMAVDVTRSCFGASIGDDGLCTDRAARTPPPQGCQGGSWRGQTCVCPRGKTLDAGQCVAANLDHGGVNCAATGTFYDGVSCVRKCPQGMVGRNGFCQ